MSNRSAGGLKPHSAMSNVSSASLDSGIQSMECSFSPDALHTLFHLETEHDDDDTPVAVPHPTETISCPVTPRHSVSDTSPLSPPRPASASRYQAKFPKPCGKTLSRRRGSSSMKLPSLPTLPESRSLETEFVTLNETLEKLGRELKLKSQSLTSLTSDDDEGREVCREERTRSDGATVVRIRKHKRARSDGDTAITVINVTQNFCCCQHLPPNTQQENEGTAASDGSYESTSGGWDYVEEDLTREEMAWIAKEIHPDKGCMLSTLLHHNTHVWAELGHAFPPLSQRDKIFSVLERWFENVSESPANRRTLAEVCKSMEQLRVASCIARKSYGK